MHNIVEIIIGKDFRDILYILPMYFDFLINQNPYMELESFLNL